MLFRSARVPAHTTASGLLLMGLSPLETVETWLSSPLQVFSSYTITDPQKVRDELRTAREQDWFVSERQLDLDYRGVAVPLRDHKGQVLAALSVSMPIGHESTTSAVERVLPLLRETAQSLRHLL